MPDFASQRGHNLIEVIVVIIIIGILSTVAVRSLKNQTEMARMEETRHELQSLAHAIAGDPRLLSGGVRTDFGYVGDVGSLPPSLDALQQNPSGYATWKGPYIYDNFSSSGTGTEFMRDAWGQNYEYSGGIAITSTGSGSSVSQVIAGSVADLLSNRVATVTTDIDNTPPGVVFRDSVRVVLTYPDGAGSLAVRALTPGADGYAVFDSIPIGIHRLNLVYLPTDDTLSRNIVVNPGRQSYLEIHLASNVW
ncbi:MAG: prepilin-type N-terminal cleavage/methylation domain-containing protein [Candidatus Zixiibacteriota bacterium]|jgi:prepilin-type N-terminal cleavage/methylation domain-containing protein